MNRPISRFLRWAAHTDWFVRRVARDIGLAAPGKHPSLWKADNPFLIRYVRESAHDPRIFLECLAVALWLAAASFCGLLLQLHPRSWPIVSFIFHLRHEDAVFAIVLSVHTFAAMAQGSARWQSLLSDEQSRQTLDTLLGIPERRGSMIAALTAAIGLRRMLPHLAALPIYAFLILTYTGSWQIVASFYVLLVLLVTTVPIMPRPIPPSTAVLARPGRAFAWPPPAAALYRIVYAVVWISFEISIAPGIVGGRMALDLCAALHIQGGARTSAIIFSWPYLFATVLVQAGGMFRISLPPIVWIVPIILLCKLSNVLFSAGILPPYSGDESQHSALAVRAVTLARWAKWTTAFCVLGFLWPVWVANGDLCELLPGATVSVDRSIAGLAVLIGFAIAPTVLWRVLMDGAEAKRSPVWRVLKRTTRITGRLSIPPLILFVLVCVAGHAWPFYPAVWRVFGRIALATVVSAAFAGGMLCFISAIRKFQDLPRLATTEGRRKMQAKVAALVLAPPFLLSFQFPGVDIIRLVSPLFAWIEVFPRSVEMYQALRSLLVQGSLDVSLAAPPSWREACLGPLLAGIALTLSGALLPRLSPLRARALLPAKPNASPQGDTAESLGIKRHPYFWEKAGQADNLQRVLLAPGWATRHSDNPVFLRELAVALGKSTIGRKIFDYGIVAVVVAVAMCFVGTYAASMFQLPWLPPPANPGVGDAVILSTGSLLLYGQAGAAMFSGVRALEPAWLEDQRHGRLGGLLITRMSDAEIFWGRLAGRVLPRAIELTILSVFGGVLSVAESFISGQGRHLAGFVTGQLLVGSVFMVAIGSGIASGMSILRHRWLMGASMLVGLASCTAIVVGFIVERAHTALTSVDALGLAVRIFSGSVAAGTLLAFIGYRTFVRFRSVDIEYGSGTSK